MRFVVPINYRGLGRLRKLYGVKTWVAYACFSIVLVSGAGLAVAETPAQRMAAKQAFVDGDAAFKQERFEDALSAFKNGFELSAKPRFLLNIGHCQKKLGRFSESLDSYQRFLATDPKSADRELAQQMVDEVTPLVAQEKAEREQRERTAQLALNPPPPVEPTVPLNDVQAQTTVPNSPLYSRWYFWAGVGTVVAAGVLVGVALSGGDSTKQVGSWGEVRL